MCIYAGMQGAAIVMFPAIDFVYRDKYALFCQLKSKVLGKAHLF